MTKNYFSHWIITTFFNRLLWLCYGLDSLVLQQSQHRSALVQWRNGSQSSLNYALLLSVLRPALFRSRCSWWPPAGKAWRGCGRGWRSSRSPPPRPAAAACTGSGTCPATSDHFSYFSIKCFSHFLNYVDYFKNSFLINQILCNDVKPIRIPSTSQPNQTFESWNSLFLFGHSSRLIFSWISICQSEGGRQCWVRGRHCTVVQNRLASVLLETNSLWSSLRLQKEERKHFWIALVTLITELLTVQWKCCNSGRFEQNMTIRQFLLKFAPAKDWCEIISYEGRIAAVFAPAATWCRAMLTCQNRKLCKNIMVFWFLRWFVQQSQQASEDRDNGPKPAAAPARYSTAAAGLVRLLFPVSTWFPIFHSGDANLWYVCITDIAPQGASRPTGFMNYFTSSGRPPHARTQLYCVAKGPGAL